jgi:hypothetical chaperone protein
MSQAGYRPEDVLATAGVSVAGDALDSSLMKGHIAAQLGAGVKYRVPFGHNELTMPLGLVHRLYSPVDMSLLSERHVLEFLRRIQAFGVSEADRAGAERLLIVAEDALGFQIYEAIERWKVELASVQPDSAGAESALFHFDYPGVEIAQRIDRGQFEEAVQPPISEIFESLDATLDQAGVSRDQIEVVCSTGGTSRVDLIAQGLRERVPKARFHSLSSFRAVVDGLAERAHRILTAPSANWN